MGRRVAELDCFKGVLILLMVAFHLIYIGDMYPYLKQVVYTFHMPGFLLISGYLMKQDMPSSKFWRTVGWLLVPYAVMETGYVVMSAWLPVREAVEHLSLQLLVDKLLLHPLGPYWYLHTLMVCYLLSRLAHGVLAASRVLRDSHGGQFLLWQFVLSMVGVFVCAQGLGILSAANGCYFMLGVLLRGSGVSGRQLLCNSWWVVLPLCLLCLWPDCLDRSTPGGMAILYLVFSLLLKAYGALPHFITHPLCYVGRNSLPIFLFSPLFTMMMKFSVPWFAFDSSGVLFLCVALGVATWGSLAIAKVMDWSGISPYFCGRKSIL